jgi:DNA-binding MarR family transcriptional regulator
MAMGELTDYTGYLLRAAFLRAAGLAAKSFPASSHPRDAALIATLEASGHCSQQQLAARLHVNRTVMVKLIDGLEQRGFVERRRNPSDRRSYAIHTTPAGRNALMELGPELERGDGEFTANLSAAERARLNALLLAVIGAAPPALADRTGFLVTQAHHRFRARADGVLAPLGIEVRQFAALTALADGVPSQRELAGRLTVSGPVVVEIVDALEARGLVERRRDAADRRSNALRVTAAGAATLADATAALLAATGELTEPIGADGDRELRALLRKLLAA